MTNDHTLGPLRRAPCVRPGADSVRGLGLEQNLLGPRISTYSAAEWGPYCETPSPRSPVC